MRRIRSRHLYIALAITATGGAAWWLLRRRWRQQHSASEHQCKGEGQRRGQAAGRPSKVVQLSRVRLLDILARIIRLFVARLAHQLLEFRIAAVGQHNLHGDQKIAGSLPGGDALAL